VVVAGVIDPAPEAYAARDAQLRTAPCAGAAARSRLCGAENTVARRPQGATIGRPLAALVTPVGWFARDVHFSEDDRCGDAERTRPAPPNSLPAGDGIGRTLVGPFGLRNQGVRLKLRRDFPRLGGMGSRRRRRRHGSLSPACPVAARAAPTRRRASRGAALFDGLVGWKDPARIRGLSGGGLANRPPVFPGSL
jgi:hypothetical protein